VGELPFENASVRSDRVRVALVTGANRGLGFETACQLLAKGLVVVLAGRDIDALERARGTLGADDRGRAVPVQLDVTNVETISAARRAIGEQVGSVDVLVNNAALLLGESDDVLAISADDYRRTFETNLFGIVEVCRVFVPPMARAGYGRVVNVSSGAGQLSRMSSYAPAYSISKVALNAFTRILADTYRNSGVLANAANPGWVRTDMGGPSAPRSPERGADTIVWLATLPDDGPTGGFFQDRRAIDW
jgi:NAD(P)-dependent dehydrogenase (short-subunit alcohol dehydrogenase family)